VFNGYGPFFVLGGALKNHLQTTHLQAVFHADAA
jgi:hypothetical protein